MALTFQVTILALLLPLLEPADGFSIHSRFRNRLLSTSSGVRAAFGLAAIKAALASFAARLAAWSSSCAGVS